MEVISYRVYTLEFVLCSEVCLSFSTHEPQLIAEDSPVVIGIRDVESVKEFQSKLQHARRIVVVGNGGIATEMV